jgi:hypothetical protein
MLLKDEFINAIQKMSANEMITEFEDAGAVFIEQILDKDTHVYCTDCENFEKSLFYLMGSKESAKNCRDNICTDCPCKCCECRNPEDSFRYEERPNYMFKRQ